MAKKLLSSDDDSRIFVANAGERGQGLFARRNLEAGEFVCTYWGKMLVKKEYEKERASGNNAYCFTDGHNLFVDASDEHSSGKARFMNDNHVKPNVTVKRIIHNSISRIVFKTTRDAPKR